MSSLSFKMLWFLVVWCLSSFHVVTVTSTHYNTTTKPANVSDKRQPSNFSSFSEVSFKNITSKILPTHHHEKNSSNEPSHHHHNHPSTSSTTSAPPTHHQQQPNQYQHHPFFCASTVPRLNLKLNKIMGDWYPVRISNATYKLWTDLFPPGHDKGPSQNSSCFTVNYSINEDSRVNQATSINVTVTNSNFSVTVGALLIGDSKHPKGSKWAIAWPNGEDTLTSVVAAGFIGKERDHYNWLLTVDCDLNGIIESDWAVMARVTEGISNATLSAIIGIVEGLNGLTVDDAITFQSEHCHN